MSPLERVFPLKEIAKIRVECLSCHTAVTFSVRGYHALNVGETCPFCHKPWGDSVERILLDLVKSVERNDDVKGCAISLEPDEAF